MNMRAARCDAEKPDRVLVCNVSAKHEAWSLRLGGDNTDWKAVRRAWRRDSQPMVPTQRKGNPMHANKQRMIVLLLVLVGLAANLHAQQQRPEIEIKTTQVAENVYMLAGAGGNLGLSVGDDGALLVDAEYAQLTEKVVAAVKAVCQTPIRFVVNTHWHFDHVGVIV